MKTNDGGGKCVPSFLHDRQAIVTRAHLAEPFQPTDRSFYDPAHLTKPAVMRRTPLGDSWCDAEPGQQPTRVIARTTSYTYDHTQQTGKAVSENSVAINSTAFEYDLQGRLEVATVTTHTAGVASRIEKTTYEYDARGIRVSALHEIDTDASGTVDSSTKTVYLNDAQSLTGYSQVLQETVIDPTTGEIQKRIVYAIGHDHIGQTPAAFAAGCLASASATPTLQPDSRREEEQALSIPQPVLS